MKKALAFVVIALVAVATQALTVNWTSGTLFNAVDKDGTWGTATADKAKSGLATAVYLVVDSATYNTYASDAESFYNDYKAGKITSTRSSGEIATGTLSSANWKDEVGVSASNTKSNPIYVLALFTQSNSYGDFYMMGTGNAFINDTSDVDGVVTGLGSAVGKWSPTPTTPVPEPCTVALLALGLAAAGLKRKVA